LSIESYVIPKLPVESKGETIFEVRGLDVTDLTFLAQNYLPDILRAVEEYGKVRRARLEARGLTEFVMLAAKDFPDLVAEIISRAADEPGQTEKAAKLPFMIQLTALRQVMLLSTEEAGGLKNLIAVLAAALQSDQQGKTGEMTALLQRIIGGSERMSASFSETDTSSPPATH
jgi:hypothetical protein